MATGLIDIDHLMVSVSDCQAAGDLFARLGFTATPRSILPGLSNRLICFPSRHGDACNFIELMSLDDPAAAPPSMPALLNPPGRPVSMVLCSDDIDRTYAALQSRDVTTPPPIHLQRDWELPSGEVISPAFAVLIPDLGQSPLYWNVCMHKTPRHYVRGEFTQHANGAEGLSAVIAAVDDPIATARHYADVWDASIECDEPTTVKLGTVALRLYGLDGIAQTFPALASCGHLNGMIGFAVHGADPAIVRERCVSTGLTPHGDDVRLYLTPDQAEGSLIVFE